MIKGYKQVENFFHFGNRTKLDSSRPVPLINSIGDLSKPEVVRAFEDVTKEIVSTNDGEIALLGKKLLEDILLPQYQSFKNKDSQAYSKYLEFIGLLKLVMIESLTLQEVGDLIQKYLLSALLYNWSIGEKFQIVLEIYNDQFVEGKIAEFLGKSMQNCEQKLGKEFIMKDNKKVSQTLGNWIKDYLEFSVSGAESSTGSLERVQFFNKNKNSFRLTKSDKTVLMRVFRVYDWLQYGGLIEGEKNIIYYRSTEVDQGTEVKQPVGQSVERKMGDIQVQSKSVDIDMKLKELGRRVRNNKQK